MQFDIELRQTQCVLSLLKVKKSISLKNIHFFQVFIGWESFYCLQQTFSVNTLFYDHV